MDDSRRPTLLFVVFGLALVVGAVWAVVVLSAEDEAASPPLSPEASISIRDGGWRDAIKPIETLPTNPDVSAQAVTARIASEYCGSDEIVEVTHSNEVPNDTRFFVPRCVPVEREGETRLDIPHAYISVTPGELPTVSVEGQRGCHVNVGARFEGFGLCVTDLLKGQ